jgi:hypothetical protein
LEVEKEGSAKIPEELSPQAQELKLRWEAVVP